MTLTTDAAAAQADADRAAYCRDALCAEREHLLHGILDRRALIERCADTVRLRSQARGAEAEVRYLERLIAALNRRFSEYRPPAEH